MKTKVRSGKMKPITITLETPFELHGLITACIRANWNDYPEMSDLYEYLVPFGNLYPEPERPHESIEQTEEETSE